MRSASTVVVGLVLAALTAMPASGADWATLSGQVLAGAHGAMALNQAAGSTNLQANVLAFGLSGQRVGAVSLQTSSAATSDDAAGGEGAVSAHVGSSADVLRGANDVVQVNQTAGSGNLTGNTVRIGFGAGP